MMVVVIMKMSANDGDNGVGSGVVIMGMVVVVMVMMPTMMTTTMTTAKRAGQLNRYFPFRSKPYASSAESVPRAQ